MWILLLLVGAVVAGVWFAIAVVFAGDKGLKKAKAQAVENADADLDEKFSGDDVVVYRSSPGTLDPETVIKGAHARGYDLTTQGDERNPWGATHLLTFKRRVS